MKGFVEYIIGAIDDTELEIALDLAPSNLTREEQIDTELFMQPMTHAKPFANCSNCFKGKLNQIIKQQPILGSIVH